MSFDQPEEFFGMNHATENGRLNDNTNGYLRILMGVAVASMWFWSGVTEDTQDIYRAAFLLSPLIGLAFIIWGIATVRRTSKTPPQPAVESLFYVLDPQGIQFHLPGPPELMPWSTLVSVTPLPKQLPMLKLLHRPVGDRFNQQRLVNGEACSRDGTKLVDRLPLWQAAMAAKAST